MRTATALDALQVRAREAATKDPSNKAAEVIDRTLAWALGHSDQDPASLYLTDDPETKVL